MNTNLILTSIFFRIIVELIVCMSVGFIIGVLPIPILIKLAIYVVVMVICIKKDFFEKASLYVSDKLMKWLVKK